MPGQFGPQSPNYATARPASDTVVTSAPTWFKDCTSNTAADGTVVTASWFNKIIEQFRSIIDNAGIAIDDADPDIIAKAVQANKWGFAVATGTANAWIVTPSLAIPAYSAGRVLWVIAPATNTSNVVNANISGLGNRRVKKADGTDPLPGDFVGGTAYPTIDDGTSIRVVSPVASDKFAEAYKGFHADGTSISIPNNVQTMITAFAGTPVNNLPGATYAGGIITIATTGYYSCTVNMGSLMPLGGAYGVGLSISKIDTGNVPILSVASNQMAVTAASLPNLATSASGIAKLNAGDRIAAFFRHNQGSAQNVTISLDVAFLGS